MRQTEHHEVTIVVNKYNFTLNLYYIDSLQIQVFRQAVKWFGIDIDLKTR